MKQKLRQVFKIGVFTTMLLAFGCSEDEPKVQDEHSGEHHLIKEVSFEELLTQTEFSNAYGKVAKTMHKNGSSLNARTAMEEQWIYDKQRTG